MNRNDLLLRFRALFFRRRAEAELQEEIAAHIESQTRKHAQSGMRVDQARRQARIDFGSLEKAKEECRDARRMNFLSRLAQDLRYALGAFRRAPRVTGLIVLMLALGLGVNLATFSVLDAVLIRMLPVKDPASLFRMVRANGNADAGGDGASYALYHRMQERSRSVAELLAYQEANSVPVSIAGADPERLVAQVVSGNYFSVLGVQPVAGRMISPPDDAEPGRQPVAVISYRLWQSRFNKSARAIGSKLQFDTHTFDIIGVAPPAFFGVEVGRMVDVWTPISTAPAENLMNDHLFWLRIIGRSHPGVSMARAAAPIQAVVNEAMWEDVRQHAPPGTPKHIIDQFLAGMRIKGSPAGGGVSYLRHQYQQPLQIMMFVVAIVLLIACSNVANLLIAKGSARRQEIAIRLSLGAGRGRIVQQLITESLLLVFLSALIGLLFARWGTPVLIRLLAPSNEPANLATGMDLHLLSFALLLLSLAVLICGLLPALRLAPSDIYSALKSGPRPTGREGGRVKKILVTAQVALSLMLVVGAVLFTRTLLNLLSSYLGFDPGHVLVAQIALQPSANVSNVVTDWNDLLRRARSLPGVEQASLASAALFTGPPPLLGIRTTPFKTVPDPVAGVLFVSDSYFQTLGIQPVNGRDFTARDNESGAPLYAIVNQTFARKFFNGQDPLGGKLTKLANSPVWTEIVGTVKDAKFSSLREVPPPMIYVPFGQMAAWLPPQAHPGESMFLHERGFQGVSSFAADLRRNLGRQFIVGEVFSQQQIIADTLVRERLLASVATLFGGLALLLAAVGLYGIMSYAVIQRKPELGIRMALGAAPMDILHLMLRDSAVVVSLGIIAGVLAAAFTTRLARTQLFGLAPDDPTTFIVAALVLLAASLTAAFIPAYRAAETDPLVALRHE